MTAGIAETAVRPLTAEQLYRPTDLSSLTFSTTAELQPIDGLVKAGIAASHLAGGVLGFRTLVQGYAHSHSLVAA